MLIDHLAVGLLLYLYSRKRLDLLPFVNDDIRVNAIMPGYIRTPMVDNMAKISCPEEVAYLHGWISKETLLEAANSMKNNQYGRHLLNVAEGKIKY